MHLYNGLIPLAFVAGTATLRESICGPLHGVASKAWMKRTSSDLILIRRRDSHRPAQEGLFEDL